MRITLTTIALMLMLTVSAFAQITAVPNSMNFQGRLTRPDGTPVPNDSYSVRFSLWTAVSGGTEKWNQTQNVTVHNGTFAALLSGFPAGTFHGNSWLEIKVGSAAPLTPRQPLVSVAYAMKADSVKDSSITSTSIANGTITAADLASNTLNNLSWLLSGNANPAAGSFLGTTTNHPLDLRVNNRRAVRYSYAQDTSSPGFEYRSINVLGGANINSIAADVVGGTIVGGGQDSFSGTDNPNTVTGNFGTVVGGALNRAGGFSFVGGGYNNKATEFYATIVGGTFNTASESQTFIGGGIGNTASGFGAVVPGGQQNEARGALSFAAGNSAHALHDGCFVWADNSVLGTPLNSTAANQFLVRAANGAFFLGPMAIDRGLIIDNADISGGALANGLRFGRNSGEGIVSKRTAGGNQWGLEFFTAFANRLSITNGGNIGIGTTNPAYKLHVNGTFGVTSLPFGDYRNVQWNSVTGQFYYDNSSRRHKENITPLKEDFAKLLDAQPVTYTRPGAPGRWEIGFIAEDFDALGLKRLVDYAEDGKTPEGINYEKICLYLTAIARQQQDTLKQQEKQINAVQSENAGLKARLDALETSLAELKTERR